MPRFNNSNGLDLSHKNHDHLLEEKLSGRCQVVEVALVVLMLVDTALGGGGGGGIEFS